MSEKDKKPRVTLGQKTTELAARFSNETDGITAASLEAAVIAIEAENEDLKAKLVQAEKVVPPVSKQLLQNETDQLFHELSALMKEQHEANLNAMNGLRYMLNVFGEDALGADVSELIKTTNDWLDQTIKPIAQSREEAQKAREVSERRPTQDGEQRDDQAAHEMLNAPQEPQAEMNLDQGPERDDGRDM